MASEVYLNILSFADDFAKESAVIDTAKCLLANNGELSDYLCSHGYVGVEGGGSHYSLYLDDLSFELTVRDRMIIDYSIS